MDGWLKTLNNIQLETRECSNSIKSRMVHALVALLHSKSLLRLDMASVKEMIRRSCSTSPIEGISQLKKDVNMLYYSILMEVGDSEKVNYSHAMNPSIKRMRAGHIQINLFIKSVRMQRVATC